ncbi:thioredoxin family protein [Chitinophaga filiformis]|uniref:thioredoxin family protein n=1 Tax=Chitinophaga filiformis TaxID=104663 RepID=UPI001F3A324C|nr:thioredoxin family protein [Chitinophaga filiformis]MCF6408119.1 thioredoxin family protein [Chitinophaga filiformis]
MQKYLLLPIVVMMCAIVTAHAQEKPALDLQHIYDPGADAAADLQKATQQAAAMNKHVLVQIGGNWCIWCKRLYKFVHEDSTLHALQEKNYIVYHLNYSKENKNLPLLKQLEYPQRFGFPVLVILDAKGNRLHTQNSALLESADTYDKEKVADMLKQWSPDALNSAHYTNQ